MTPQTTSSATSTHPSTAVRPVAGLRPEHLILDTNNNGTQTWKAPALIRGFYAATIKSEDKKAAFARKNITELFDFINDMTKEQLASQKATYVHCDFVTYTPS